MFDDVSSKVKKYIEYNIPIYMRKLKIPGFCIAVILNDDVIYIDGFGSRNLELNLPANADTLCSIGSCTKSFTALAIMQLIEKKKLCLKDSIDQYLPVNIKFNDNPITVHHLLSHSSGIPALGTGTIGFQRGFGNSLWIPWGGINDFYRYINQAQDEIVSEPGERYFYFNGGYRMLGHIIQNVSGIPYYEYITKYILHPLGMKRSTISKNEYLNDPNHMIPYKKTEEGKVIPSEFPFTEVSDNPDTSFIVSAGGGITSSVNELTNYLFFLNSHAKYKNTKIINQESIKKMLEIKIDFPENHFGRCGYGYGWRITENFLGHKMVTHSGSISVSTAHLAIIPELKMGTAMVANASGIPFDTISQCIFAALMRKDPNEVIPAVKINNKLCMFSGNYELYKKTGSIRITRRAGLLYLENPSQGMCIPIFPEDNTLETNRFYIWSEGLKKPVEFIVYPDNKVDLFYDRYRYHKTRLV